MANSASAKKRIRQNEKRRVRNQRVRTRVTTRVREFRNAVEEGDVEKAEEAYRQAASQLDVAARKNIIPKERASRKKSRMAKQIDNLR